MPHARARPSSPLAALGGILVALALGALAARHRATRPPEAPARIESAPERASGPLDLNTADARALEALPRIGPALAARIVEDRERHGPFRDVDDLARVPGIGPATVASLRSLVRVTGEP